MINPTGITNTYTVNDALRSLTPNADWVWSTEEGLRWQDIEQVQPTDNEIAAEIIRLQAEYDAQQYAINRRLEYPSIEECVHAILDNEVDALQVKRAGIKAKYPKP